MLKGFLDLTLDRLSIDSSRPKTCSSEAVRSLAHMPITSVVKSMKESSTFLYQEERDLQDTVLQQK